MAVREDTLNAIDLESIARSAPMVETETPRKGPAGARRVGAIELPVLCLIIGGLLLYAWQQSDEGHLTAETGIGYYLGISGSVLMLALLLYPLRKRLHFLRIIGGVKSWFRLHMMLGVIGPALILLHSNFSLGSFNSTVALVCMLIVAGSGFVGRFLYGRIHKGLYGRKANIREFLDDAGTFKQQLLMDELGAPQVLDILKDFERHRLKSSGGLLKQIWRAATAGFAGRRLRRQIIKDAKQFIDQQAMLQGMERAKHKQQLKNYRFHLNQYFVAVARAEAFVLYERLFSLWHLLHLPLFMILILAALTHVVAVHLY